MTDTNPPDPNEATVVPLPPEVVEGAGHVPPPSGPVGRLHGLAITGLAVSALAGISSMIAFVTVGWSGSASHYVIGAVVLAAVAFLAFASIAVFTAARDTYPRTDGDTSDGE